MRYAYHVLLHSRSTPRLSYYFLLLFFIYLSFLFVCLFGHVFPCGVVIINFYDTAHNDLSVSMVVFRLPKKIRKFWMGCKWKTTFWFVPLGIVSK